jgi:hypothetical protein
MESRSLKKASMSTESQSHRPREPVKCSIVKPRVSALFEVVSASMGMASEGLETACTWVAQKAPSTYIAWLKISGTGGRYWIIDGPSLEVSSSAAGPCSRAISILFLPSSFHQLLLQQQLIEEIWISSLAAAVARSLAAASKLHCASRICRCARACTRSSISACCSSYLCCTMLRRRCYRMSSLSPPLPTILMEQLPVETFCCCIREAG